MKLTYEAPEMKIYAFSMNSTILTASEPYTENPITQSPTAFTIPDDNPFEIEE